MEISITHDTLSKILISGSVTSANAHELESAVASEPCGTNGIEIDAAGLEYISSAGLRIILAMKKRCGDKTFRIINANDDVMNVFDVTGFSEIMDISKAKRKFSIENCVKIGAGACGEVYRIDDERIIKLYYPQISNDEIEREKALAKKAFVLGVPTAISYDIVECDGRLGVVYELIKSKTLGELIRDDGENLEKYVDMYADVCRRIHKIEASGGDLPTFKDINRQEIPNIVDITDEERQLLYDFLDMVPDRCNCIHGDLNLNNIMVDNGECCLIDMGEFSTGMPMFDISRIVFSMEFASDKGVDYNAFYKMPAATVERIYRLFLKKYFMAETFEEAAKKNKDMEWLYPMAWFRCCTAFLKQVPWSEEKKVYGLELLRENLIPFIKAHQN
jgi:uncharacterized protein (TIGR02172 family)